MYEEFYSLTDEPFNTTSDPKFLYLSKKHEGALDHLLCGIERRRGLTVLTGEIGAGKTTLLNTIVQRLDNKTHIAFLAHSQISPLDIYKYIFYEFRLNIDVSGKTGGDLLIILKDFLITCENNGENCVFIVDEAQNLSQDVLEEIRLLLNFETYNKKLIQIILVGHTQLHEKLNLLASAKLKQRISVVYNLLPLDDTETKGYIERRLSVAGATRPIFADGAIAEIYRCSRGIPRLINVVCDAALVIGFERKQRTIDQNVILQVEQMLNIQSTDAATERSIEPEQAQETAGPVVPPAAEPRGLTNRLLRAAEPRGPTDRLLRAEASPYDDVLRWMSGTTLAQTRSKRRGSWWSWLGGMAAGVVLSLVTWSGFVQHPERLTQGIAQLGRQMLAAMPFSTQRTVRPLADAERVTPQAEEAPGPFLATPSMRTVPVPTAPLTEGHTELGTDLQTPSRLGQTLPEGTQAPAQNDALPGTIPGNPALAPTGTVRPQVPPPAPHVIVVQTGNTLGEIILRTYKRLDNQLLTMVQEANPGMTNPSHIEVGQRIVLPVLQ